MGIKVSLSNAERQRRYMRRLKAHARLTEKLQARVCKLEAQISEVAPLKRANEELNRKVQVLLRWHETEMRKLRGRKKMPAATFHAVIKCLHPDHRGGMTSKQIDEACGLFTQWKKAQDR